MTESADKRALIVEQVTSLGEEGEEALRLLATEHGLDLYSSRQRLIGGGHAHFGSGSIKKVGLIAEHLEDAGIRTWLISPSRPRFGPLRLRALEQQGDQLQITTPQQNLTLESSDKVIAILSDISGDIVDKQLKRLMAQKVYQGIASNDNFDEA